jgi:hypothetical protein
MKIYTEVIYTWDDNKGELVEESSKSFDYEGPIVSCHWYHRHSKPSLPKVKIKVPTIKIKLPKIKFPEIKFPKLPKITLPKVVLPKPPIIKPPKIGGSAGDLIKGGNKILKKAGSAPSAAVAAANKANDYMKGMKDRKWNIRVPKASDFNFQKTVTGALGEVGKGLGKITGAVTEGISTGTSAIGAEASSAGQAATTNVSNLGTGSGGTTGQVASGVMHGGEQVSNVVTSGVTKGLKGTETGISNVLETAGKGIEKTKSNILGLHKDIKGGLKYYRDKMAQRLGSDKLLGGLSEIGSSMIGGSGPGSKSAPGVSETIGSKSSNITMKKAVAAKGQRVKASSRGKRSLRKIA